jgi:energy-converting hydrogenase A subunit M
MSTYLYEKDLTSQKFAILASPRHDRMVREIADDLGIKATRLRRYMMDHFDMILMENLPARYEQAKRAAGSLPDTQLRATLYSRAVPLVDEERMGEIVGMVYQLIRKDVPEAEAVASGKKMIRELIAA